MTGKVAELIPIHQCSMETVQEVCRILTEKWPSRPPKARMRWLHESGCQHSNNSLPMSYALELRNDDQTTVPVGHARLSQSLKVGGGVDMVSIIATSVIIHPGYRRRGLGRTLMKLLEEKSCQSHGLFGRMVLWTDDQVKFYESCGYIKCRPLRVVSAAAGKMQAEQLTSLESMLTRKIRKAEEIKIEHKVETISNISIEDTGDGGNGADSVWLSKRLRDSLPPSRLDRNQVENDIFCQLKRQSVDVEDKQQPKLCLSCDVPNETQIGPCCGIAALRCIKAYYSDLGPSSDHTITSIMGELLEDKCTVLFQSQHAAGEEENEQISMLEYAKRKQWTIDGEMFNAINLAKLGFEAVGLDTCLLKDMSGSQLVSLISHGIPVLVAFDKSPKDLENCVSVDTPGGLRAHWGTVRGVVVDRQGDNHEVVLWCNDQCPDTMLKDYVLKNVDEGSLFVILQHTKHDRVSVVPFLTLRESNQTIDDCCKSDDFNIGWIESDRMLANSWLVCTPRN